LNTCIRGTFECNWEEIEANIRADLAGEAADFVLDFSLVRETQSSFIMLCDLNNFQSFVSFIHKPEVQEAYTVMGVKLKVYSMSLIER
tara:strand:+ start:687 stop:950 length:264 start_codon:yes stop_codon:yes gene_type:complete